MIESNLRAGRPGRPALWTARVVGTLTVLFLAFDALGKFLKPQAVIDAFARLGLSIALAPTIGALLLILIVLYAVPRTRILAAILLTGYLGGAIAINLRAADPAFETLFPAIIGILVWLPPFLLDARLRALVPFVTATASQVR